MYPGGPGGFFTGICDDYQPRAVLLNIDLISFWNILLPDSCCCSVGGGVRPYDSHSIYKHLL